MDFFMLIGEEININLLKMNIFSKNILKSHNSKTKKDIYALKYGTPLVELNRSIECLDILHTYSRVLRVAFRQLMKQLKINKLIFKFIHFRKQFFLSNLQILSIYGYTTCLKVLHSYFTF